MSWWLDFQESFYIVFAPCLVGIVLPFFLAGVIVIAIHTAIRRITPGSK